MTFFNKKEEVIDIQLTPFGKILHSKGKLKPSYYAFFDDDIIYDSEYGSSGGNVDDRIESTPRPHAQAKFTSVNDVATVDESSLSYFVDAMSEAARNSILGQQNRDANTQRQDEKTKQILVQEQKRRNAKPPIGTSANDTKYHPSWKAYMLQGELESSLPYIETSTSSSVINIPQMEIKTREFTSKAIRGTDENSSLYGHIFPDGSSITLKRRRGFGIFTPATREECIFG